MNRLQFTFIEASFSKRDNRQFGRNLTDAREREAAKHELRMPSIKARRRMPHSPGVTIENWVPEVKDWRKTDITNQLN
jgi:hypothetical protein